MTYAGEYIIENLKAAREGKQLSQRALGARAGVPQSHISKIESGAVDLQLSSVIELARLLDLELMLVPRSLVPAVRGIVRSPDHLSAERARANVAAQRELSRMSAAIDRASGLGLRDEERRELDANIKLLSSVRLSPTRLQELRSLLAQLKLVLHKKVGTERLRDIIQSLQRLRNVAVHDATEHLTVRPAYSIEDEDSDG